MSVPCGTVCSLLGPNGAGKTTAVRILATLAKPDSGTATVDDDLTGRENLFILGLMHHLGRPGAKRVDTLLEQFGLAYLM